MKITRYAMMLAAATGLLSACQKLDEVKAYDPDKVVAPVLHALPGEIVITPDNMGSTQTFTWDAADFGVRTQINYSIEASYNDGAKLVLFTGMNGTSSEQTYESLNNILALSVEDGGLGVPSGEPTDVDFYISATIGTDFEKFYSAPATVRMTVTTAERTYPQVWVIGDYCGWNFDNAQGLFCFSGDEVTYEAIVDLGEKAANGFKLSGEAGWNDACNWGTDGDAAAPETEAPSITLISSGGSGNIMVFSKRFYRFVFDRSTLTLSNKLSFNSMGIIGDATPGGWDTDTEMNFDTQKQRFWVDVTLTAGEFKFRADNDWAINFGGADGRLSQNGDNIKATAGNYRVYATLNNSAEITYELNAGDYGTGGGEEPDPGPEKADWYIHGQTVATPDWGPTVTVTETTDAANADNTQGGPDDKYLYFGNGTSKRFYARGGNSYELTLDFDSDWGFLVRTSTTSWAAGTKYGAPDNRTIIRFGEPFTLMSNRSADPANVQFSLPTMYHSHFWTAAFADLNYGKAAEAEQSGAFKAVAEAADKWVRMGVDGFRLDAVKHIYHNAYNDENPTFLKKFYDRMNESYKAAGGEGDFYMVGEMLDEADKAAPYYRGLPALFEFTFWYKLKWALQNGIGCYFVKDILDVQPLYAQYRSDYIEATKLSNHDEDRTGSDLGQSVEKMKVAAAVLLTAQGAPYIYQGEELGYWGTKSNGDEYVRTPILRDKAGNELASGSLSGKIDMQMLTAAISVEAQADDDGSLLNLYRTFARLRNTYPVLAQGKMVKHPVYNDGNTSQQSIAAWYRELDGERMLVVHNFGQETQILTLTDQPDKAVGVSGEVKLQRGDASSKLLMGAWSSVVFAL